MCFVSVLWSLGAYSFVMFVTLCVCYVVRFARDAKSHLCEMASRTGWSGLNVQIVPAWWVLSCLVVVVVVVLCAPSRGLSSRPGI